MGGPSSGLRRTASASSPLPTLRAACDRPQPAPARLTPRVQPQAARATLPGPAPCCLITSTCRNTATLPLPLAAPTLHSCCSTPATPRSPAVPSSRGRTQVPFSPTLPQSQARARFTQDLALACFSSHAHQTTYAGRSPILRSSARQELIKPPAAEDLMRARLCFLRTRPRMRAGRLPILHVPGKGAGAVSPRPAAEDLMLARLSSPPSPHSCLMPHADTLHAMPPHSINAPQRAPRPVRDIPKPCTAPRTVDIRPTADALHTIATPATPVHTMPSRNAPRRIGLATRLR
jgi:hypothetical protein